MIGTWAPSANRFRVSHIRVVGSRRAYLRLAGRLLAASASIWLLAVTLPITIGVAASTPRLVGDDFALYRSAAASWVAGGPFYPVTQLSGPWTIAGGAILYPPVILWILVPFLVLPTILWWVVPCVAIGWSIWRLRPGALSWPIMAFLIGFSPLPAFIRAGNPMMWALAALFLGCATVGPSVFVLLKPSLAPFALFGAWHRRWWVWAAAFGVASVPFGGLWLDWARSVLTSDGTLAYSYREVGLFLIPLTAWAGRRSAGGRVVVRPPSAPEPTKTIAPATVG